MGIKYSESFQSGFTSVINFIPHLLGALVILLIGWIVAKSLGKITSKLLNRIRFDRALHTSAGGKFIDRLVESPSRFVGKTVYWLVYLAFISFAAASLNLALLNTILAGIYSYVPKVIAAILIFLVASAISVESTRFVQRVMGKTALAKMTSAVIPAITMSLAVFMILNQLDIAKDIVNILFTAIVGSVALGLALAFGLGGRDVARELLEQAVDSARQNSDQARAELQQARSNARAEATAARNRAQQ